MQVNLFKNIDSTDPTGNRTSYIATFDTIFLEETARQIVYEIAKGIAEKYIGENYAQIVAKLDQQAIANLAVADAGKKIAEEIRTRPVVLHDGCKTINNRWSIL